MANIQQVVSLHLDYMANVWQRPAVRMANVWRIFKSVEFSRKEKLGFSELLQKSVENSLCSLERHYVSTTKQTTRSEQFVNNKIRFTTWLTPSTDLLITDLAKEMNTTKCSVVENALKFYAGNDNNNNELDVLRKQLNKVQEQNEHLLNILNSLCVALGYNTAEFAPADSKPSKWLQESKNIHHQKMLKKKTDKLINESEYH